MPSSPPDRAAPAPAAPRRPTHATGTNFKTGSRHVFKAFLILAQLIFLALSFHFISTTHHNNQIRTFPTLSTSRQHFINSLRPFSYFRHCSRVAATLNYLDAPDIDQEELSMLQFFIHDYLPFHQSARRRESSRRLIFRPRRAGMGDTFGTLVFAYWASVLSRRVFLVDWRKPFPLEDLLQAAHPNTDPFFRHGVDMVALNNSHVLFGTPESHQNFTTIISSNMHTIIYSPERRPFRPVLEAFIERNAPKHLSQRTIYAVPYQQTFIRAFLHNVFRYNDAIRKDHAHLARKMKLTTGFFSTSARMHHTPAITPSPTKAQTDERVDKQVEDGSHNLKQLNDDYKSRPYIAVHARIGTGVGEGGGRFNNIAKNAIIPARCLASRAVRLSLMTGTPPLPIFLATDTEAFRQVFDDVVRNIGDGRVEVLSGDWNVVHTSKVDEVAVQAGKVLNKSEDAWSWRAVWGGYMDLAMIGHAEHIVSLYSSFPRLAFGLGDAETITELRNDVCTKEEQWGS